MHHAEITILRGSQMFGNPPRESASARIDIRYTGIDSYEGFTQIGSYITAIAKEY